MNERLEELARQARDHANNYVSECKHYGHLQVITEFERQFEKRFAELLVKDCISQIALIGISNSDDPDVVWTVDRSIETIKQHFGVE